MNPEEAEARISRLEKAARPLDEARIDRLEEQVAAAGTPQDAPHHEMAHDVAAETVKASERSQRRMIDQMQHSVLVNVRWFVALAACAFFVAYLLAR